MRGLLSTFKVKGVNCTTSYCVGFFAFWLFELKCSYNKFTLVALSIHLALASLDLQVKNMCLINCVCSQYMVAHLLLFA